jgi:hypothetical protein
MKLEKQTVKMMDLPELNCKARCKCGIYFDVKIQEGANNALYECPGGICRQQYNITRTIKMAQRK